MASSNRPVVDLDGRTGRIPRALAAITYNMQRIWLAAFSAPGRLAAGRAWPRAYRTGDGPKVDPATVIIPRSKGNHDEMLAAAHRLGSPFSDLAHDGIWRGRNLR